MFQPGLSLSFVGSRTRVRSRRPPMADNRFLAPESTLSVNPTSVTTFQERGFVRIEALLSPSEAADLRTLYMSLVDSKAEAVAKHRYDLGEGDTSPKKVATEKILQIMWPSDAAPALRDHPVRTKGLALARQLHGDDSFEFDFDMLIAKAPHTDTPTPAHQDQAYWPKLTVSRHPQGFGGMGALSTRLVKRRVVCVHAHNCSCPRSTQIFHGICRTSAPSASG